MIIGKLLNGDLTDIRRGIPVIWGDGGVDVPLIAMPTDAGPWTYDKATQSAVLNASEVKANKIAEARDAADAKIKAMCSFAEIFDMIINSKVPKDLSASIAAVNKDLQDNISKI